MRLGLKLVIESNFPGAECFGTTSKSKQPISPCFSQISILLLGCDTDVEKVVPFDIFKVKEQFPEAKLIVLADSIPDIQIFYEQGMAAHLSKQASAEEVVNCIREVIAVLHL